MSTGYPREEMRPPFGLPPGSVRGFIALLITAFFWIVLLLPESRGGVWVPVAHYVLMGLVFLAFFSNPGSRDPNSPWLPWVIRAVILVGSVGVFALAASRNLDLAVDRLNPDPGQSHMWLPMFAAMAGGFGFGLLLRSILGHEHGLFQNMRAWISVVAILLLVAESVFQFVILPGLSDPPNPQALTIWQGVVVAPVAAYFGSRQ